MHRTESWRGLGASLALTLLTLAGCASDRASAPRATVSPSGTTSGDSTPLAVCAEAPCVGTISAHPSLAVVDDDALLASAIGTTGQGKLCTGAVFEARARVRVYRLYGGQARDRGRWWSLERPTGDAASYRAANAICAAWNDLTTLNECELPIGAKVVVGPGQSVSCDEGCFPPSATNQTFVPDPSVLEGCVSAAWP